MPDPPDFDQIARQMAVNHAERRNIDGLDELTRIVEDGQRLRLAIAEQLRQVWNARGAADCETVRTEAAGTVWTGVLARAIRKLDR